MFTTINQHKYVLQANYCSMLNKMIIRPSPTLGRCARTSIADEADARHADAFVATLLRLKDTLI